MPADEIELTCEEAMEKAVEFLKKELRGVRTGRASAGLVEHLRVNVPSYGAVMELRELASISTPDATMILVKPFDPTTCKDIEKAIQNSDVGITPMSDGKIIRLPVPPLSGERRQQLAQQVKKMAEAQRVAIRNARRDANKQIDVEHKAGDIPEDDAERLKKTIQDLTDRYEKEIDRLLGDKTREIQEV
jgi:ribosome recycling factor